MDHALHLSILLTLASAKMYKTRIKQWRLDKKNKESDMKAIVRKRAKRLNESKVSLFHVRGKAVDFEEVVRYWERKGISIEDVATQRDASATPVDVRCLTPAASQGGTPIFALMATPNELAIPEQMLIMIQDYVRGSFDSGTWIQTHPCSQCYSSKDGGTASKTSGDIHFACSLACVDFSQGHFQEAGATLIHATAAIKEILLAEDPHTLNRLMTTFRHCLYKGRHEIALAILRHSSNMGEVLLGERHPLPRICQWLASHDRQSVQQALERYSKMIRDLFANINGPLHSSTLNVSFSDAVIAGYSDPTHARTRLRLLLEDCQRYLGSHDTRTVQARTTLMDHLFYWGDKAEAERHALIILFCAEGNEYVDIFYLYRAHALRALSLCYIDASKFESGIKLLNQALELHGHCDIVAIKWLLDLESWHLQLGNYDAAIQARNKRSAIWETQKAAAAL